MILRTPKELQEIKKRFLEKYKGSKTELNYKNDYELLVAIILSAQCTDKRVNMVTPKLFEKYPNIDSLACADVEEVKECIKSCNFYNNKAKNLVAMAKIVKDTFNSKIPHEHKELIKLPGVGNKTANVFLIELDGANRMAVDTHVFRVVHRLGITDARSVKETEKDLVEAFKTDLNELHQAFVLFGRYICTAKNPKCEKCFVSDFCISKENFKPS
ncbi:endonuclease III [Caminibacter mediatlanticus TB-2]|uniref:Endonuclease III n=1 Tax=Caminibacter mediatlanticus TB-2 TaxID=391592 RepID=A0ABX5V8L4_9BACT|nr:endonuclease III [Caminibacter mediatlanticus]QCT94309.1 endonuclease III [Caminibacter mediatlanticus TB-2]